MAQRWLVLSVLLVAGCAPTRSPTAPSTPRASASSSTPHEVVAPAPPPPTSPGSSSPVPTLETERRAMLAELVAVDTSHGHETDVLRPIASALRPGCPTELVESAARARQPRRALQGDRREEAAPAHRARRRRARRGAAVDGAALPRHGEGRLSLGPRRQRRQGHGRRNRRPRPGDRPQPTPSRATSSSRSPPAKRPAGRGRALAHEHRKDLIDAEIALNEGGDTWLADD